MPLCHLWASFVLACFKNCLDWFHVIVWFGYVIASWFQRVGEMLGFVKIQTPLHLILASVLVSGSWRVGTHQFQQVIVLARLAQQRSGTGESVCGRIYFMLAFSYHDSKFLWFSWGPASSAEAASARNTPTWLCHHYVSLFLFLLFFSLPVSCLSLELAVFGCVSPRWVGPSAVWTDQKWSWPWHKGTSVVLIALLEIKKGI